MRLTWRVHWDGGRLNTLISISGSYATQCVGVGSRVLRLQRYFKNYHHFKVSLGPKHLRLPLKHHICRESSRALNLLGYSMEYCLSCYILFVQLLRVDIRTYIFQGILQQINAYSGTYLEHYYWFPAPKCRQRGTLFHLYVFPSR